MKRLTTLLFLLLFGASFAFAQRPSSTYGASESHPEGSIDLNTLVPTFRFPVVTKNVGALPGSLVLESPQNCFIGPTGMMGQSPWRCGNSNTDPGVSLYHIENSLIGVTLSYTLTTPSLGCTEYFINGLSGVDKLTFYPLSLTIWYPSTCGAVSGTATTYDGSGITATISAAGGAGPFISTWTDASGDTGGLANPNWTVTDPFNNFVEDTGSSFTDTLGAVTNFSGLTGGLPTQYSYTDTTGTVQDVTLNTGTASTYVPLGSACGTSGTGGTSVTPITSISYPDSTSIGLHWQTNGSGLSGLIDKVTLRTGGQITYTYGTLLDNGCLDSTHSISIWAFNSLKRTTPDGEWDYTTTNTSGIGTAGTITTTVLDPGKNKTVYTSVVNSIQGIPFLVSVYSYQNTNTPASPTYALSGKVTYCYNGDTCPDSTAPSGAVTQRDIYTYIGSGPTSMSHEVQTFDSTYGVMLTDATTELTTTPNQTVTTTYVYGTWNGSNCVAITNTAVHNRPCTITTTNGSNQLSKETLTYNSNGAVTADATWISNTDTLTTNYTRNSNGTAATVTTPNSQVITNTFGSCNSLMLTDSTTTVNSVVIDNKTSWNCNAGLVTDRTDPNSNESDYTYDSENRPASITDPTEFVMNFTYPTSTSTESSWSMTSPSASAATTITSDSLGRPINSQTTHGSNYDTLSSNYAFSGANWQIQTSEPCSTTTIGSTGCTSFAHTITLDPWQRVMTAVTTSNQTMTGTYSANDASLKLSPAPGTENAKIGQQEFNGFGQLKSICALLNSGGTACGQSMGNSGILTTYAYTYGSGSFTVAVTRGSQTHTTVYDAAGRKTSETYPESGTTTYTYDSVAAAYCASSDGAYSSPGNLVATADGAGNHVCYKYDGLNRVLSEDTNHNDNGGGTGSVCRHFAYDASANLWNSAQWGTLTFTNAKGHMIEATTELCNGAVATSYAFYAFDADGRITSEEMTGYGTNGARPFTATYYPNGVLHTNGGTVASYTVGIDANGNPISVSTNQGPTTLINNITRDSGGRPTVVQLNNTNDTDNFAYDPNTGNVTSYGVTVNGSTSSGALTWNGNETLGKLVVTDGFNSAGSQTCNFGYDDVARLTSDNCGSLFAQTFGYDQYDNLSQSGSFTSGCAGCYSSTTNQNTSFTYDGAGRLTNDVSNNYYYDAYGSLIGVSGACGSLHQCYWPDAFGRPTVINHLVSGSNPQTLSYGIGGLKLITTNTNPNGAGNYVFAQRFPMPGGVELYDGGSGTSWSYQHPDWLGSDRIVSLTGRTVYTDQAFAPYGQTYDVQGAATGPLFASMHQDVNASVGIYDTDFRALNQTSGRFQTCDPIHGASWNCYVYPTDPNTHTDPSGLCADPLACGSNEASDSDGQDPIPLPDENSLLGKIWQILSGVFGGGGGGESMTDGPLFAGGGGGGSGSGFGIGQSNSDPTNNFHFWRRTSRVDVVFRGFSKDFSNYFFAGMEQVSDLNDVDYEKFVPDDPQRPFLTHNENITDVWNSPPPDGVFKQGDVAYNDNTHGSPKDWLHYSAIYVAPQVSSFVPWKITDLGKFEEEHNNGFPDCPSCPRGSHFDMHVSTRQNYGEYNSVQKAAYWANLLTFILHNSTTGEAGPRW